MLKDYGDTNFVTGMRAYAALAVVMVHSGGAGLRGLGPIGNHLADLGPTGVYVFFVISGFSVATSYDAAPSYRSYLVKRMLRIAPLYYAWLVIAAATLGIGYWGKHLGMELDAYNWFMHLSFLGFLDYRVTNSILGVEWSIPIEVFWYVMLPLIFRPIVRTRFGVPVALVVSLASYYAIEGVAGLLPMPRDVVGLALHWNPLPYLFSYCLGVAAYKLRRPRADWLIVGILLAWALCALTPVADPFLFTSVGTFLLLCTGSGRSKVCAIFDNPLMLYLGTISYGLYLCHLPLREWLGLENRGLTGFLELAAAAAAASTLTYFLIELPVARLGRKAKTPSRHEVARARAAGSPAGMDGGAGGN